MSLKYIKVIYCYNCYHNNCSCREEPTQIYLNVSNIISIESNSSGKALICLTDKRCLYTEYLVEELVSFLFT